MSKKTKTNPSLEISQDEWMEEIQRLNDPEGKGFTASELEDIMGVRRAAVQKHLSRAYKAGRIAVSRKKITTMTGVEMIVPSYYLVDPPSKR